MGKLIKKLSLMIEELEARIAPATLLITPPGNPDNTHLVQANDNAAHAIGNGAVTQPDPPKAR